MNNFYDPNFFLQSMYFSQNYGAIEIKKEKPRLSFGIDTILGLSSPESEPVEPKKIYRRRTVFTENQILELEKQFSQSHYLIGQGRIELAVKLSIEPKQVKIWFQNRRIKEKRNLSSDSE